MYWCKGEQITMVQITLLEISTMTGLTLITDKTDGFQTVGYALTNELLSVYKRRALFCEQFWSYRKEKWKEKCLLFFTRLQLKEWRQ